MGGLAFSDALQVIWNLVSAANRYVDQTAAWDLNKDPARGARLDQVLYCQAEAVRICAVLLSPFMPETAERIWEQLGAAGTLGEQNLLEAGVWGGLAAGTRVNRGSALFPRLEA
jgi:methionyl-tRNA synthetase